MLSRRLLPAIFYSRFCAMIKSTCLTSLSTCKVPSITPYLVSSLAWGLSCYSSVASIISSLVYIKVIWSITASLDELRNTRNSRKILCMEEVSVKNFRRWFTVNHIAWSNHNTSPRHPFLSNGEHWHQKYKQCQLKSPEWWFSSRLPLVARCTLTQTLVGVVHLCFPNPSMTKNFIAHLQLMMCTLEIIVPLMACSWHLTMSYSDNPAHWCQRGI